MDKIFENRVEYSDKHSRFIQDEEHAFIFGCINPFCGHGSPALPNRYKIPKETNQIMMKLLSHRDRKLEIEVTIKENGGKVILVCDDNLKSCADAFANIDI